MYTIVVYQNKLILTKKLHDYKYCLFTYRKSYDLTFADLEKYSDIDYKKAMKSCASYILELISEAKAIEKYTNDKIEYFESVLSSCKFEKTLVDDNIKKITYKLQRFIEEYQNYIRYYFRCVSLNDSEKAEEVTSKGKKIILKIKKYQNKYLEQIDLYIKNFPCRHSFANREENCNDFNSIFSQFVNLRHYATESLIKIDILLSLAKEKLRALNDKNLDLLLRLEHREKSYFEENTFFGEYDLKERDNIIGHYQIPSFNLGFRSDENAKEKMNTSETIIKPLCHGCTHNLSQVEKHTGLCRVTCETCLQGTHRKHAGQCLPKNKKLNKTIVKLLSYYDIEELSNYFDEDIKVTVNEKECQFNKLPADLFFILPFFIDKLIILND